jgi:hypothetical protein
LAAKVADLMTVMSSACERVGQHQDWHDI